MIYRLRSSSWTTVFDLDKKKTEIDRLTKKSEAEGFWQDAQQAGQVMKQIEHLKKDIDQWERIKSQIGDLLQMAQDSAEGSEELSLVEESYHEIEKEFQEYEKIKLYSGKYDERSAIVSIHAGAGGVDAQDWSEMLLRMYLRYCEQKGYRARIIDETRGSEAGIKSVTIEVDGQWAYGNLRAEAGVHRLVRLSPFNADNLRQTSFALLEVVPAIEHDREVEINAKDLRIDTYRASGAGGQHVNKTDSAVRITHVPTNIVVSCQSERSQMQNRERAMAILKAKLLLKQEQEKQEQEKSLKGEHKSAQWGNQIRSYVLHPYQMVKDHRTGYETSDTEGVLNGSLDRFIEEYLRKQ